MKNKKIPMRMCVVSKESLPKKELVRIVRTPEMEVKIDLIGKENGRGAYIKKDVSVLEKARNSKILEKKLECVIPDNIYDELLEICKK